MWQLICEREPDLKNLILLHLWHKDTWPKNKAGEAPWKGHPFVDPARNTCDRNSRLGLLEPDPAHPDRYLFPTYENWKDFLPALPVVVEVQRRNNRRHYLRHGDGAFHYLSSEEESDDDDYLHARHRVFQPDEEIPASGNLRRNILHARKTRRARQERVLELFYRMNLYDLPERRLGDIKALTKFKAPILGVPKEDKYIRDLKSALWSTLPSV